MVNPSVIVIAPQGAGKTRLAEQLRQRFGLTSIVDNWDGVSVLPPGSLALSNLSLDAIAAVTGSQDESTPAERAVA